MIKRNKSVNILLGAMFATLLLTPATGIQKAKAEEGMRSIGVENTRGIYTNLSLYMDGGDGTVSAIVKNQFTLLPAQVQVYVELYCSDTYQDNYENMELVVRNYTADLNMGEKIYATASTNGETKYWLGRMRSRLDNNAWEETISSTLLIDGNGNLIG